MTNRQLQERAAPAPWTYHNRQDSNGPWLRDWIEDANGNIVIVNIGHIDGPRIVRAINTVALAEAAGVVLVEGASQ